MIDYIKLRGIDPKNFTYYYLDGLININALDFENINLDLKACEDTCVYCIGYELLYYVKRFCIIFNIQMDILRIMANLTSIPIDEEIEISYSHKVQICYSVIESIVKINTRKSQLIRMSVYLKIKNNCDICSVYFQ